MRKRVLLAIMVTTLLVAILVGFADAQVVGTGIIEGQLSNGTPGGGSVADLKVSLETYVDNALQGEPLSTQTDADGKFRFTGLSTISSNTYVVWVKYQAADYGGAPITFKEDEASKSVKIDVFEETESDAAITVANRHTIIEPSQGQLLVTEVVRFVNGGDRTYIGSPTGSDGKRETLRFQLPDGAHDFKPGQGLVESFITPFEGGFNDSMPLVPGMNDISFIYVVAPGADSYTFSQPLGKYPVANFSFVVQVDDIDVKADGMFRGDAMDIEGRKFVPFSTTNVQPGTPLQIEFKGLSKTVASTDDGGRSAIWIIPVAIAILLAFGLAYTVVRGRKPRPAPVAAVSASRGLQGEREILLQEIARLDDQFERGNLAEDVYRQRRAEKKARLLELSTILTRNS